MECGPVHGVSGAFKKFWNPKDFREQLAARYGSDSPALWDRTMAFGFMTRTDRSMRVRIPAFVGVRWYMAGDLGEVLPEKMGNLKIGNVQRRRSRPITRYGIGPITLRITQF